MSWQIWVLLVWQIAGLLSRIGTIGMVREPVTHEDAVVMTVLSVVVIVLLVTGAS